MLYFGSFELWLLRASRTQVYQGLGPQVSDPESNGGGLSSKGNVISVRLGHGLYPVVIVFLTLAFPWQHIA